MAQNPYDCTVFVPYDDTACAEDEGGRVRHLAFIETAEMPTDPLALTSAFILGLETATKAVVLRNVSGTYDGGADTTGSGFGDQQERVTGKVHTLVFKDLNALGNEAFYESLEKRAGLYTPVWFTESRMWVASAVVPSVSARIPVPENTTDPVVGEGTIKWSKKAIVRTYTGFDIKGLLSGTATTGPGGTTNLPAQ